MQELDANSLTPSTQVPEFHSHECHHAQNWHLDVFPDLSLPHLWLASRQPGGWVLPTPLDTAHHGFQYPGMTGPGPQSPLGSHAGRGTPPIHRSACGGARTGHESPDGQSLQRKESPDWKALWSLVRDDGISFPDRLLNGKEPDAATDSMHSAQQPDNTAANGSIHICTDEGCEQRFGTSELLQKQKTTHSLPRSHNTPATPLPFLSTSSSPSAPHFRESVGLRRPRTRHHNSSSLPLPRPSPIDMAPSSALTPTTPAPSGSRIGRHRRRTILQTRKLVRLYLFSTLSMDRITRVLQDEGLNIKCEFRAYQDDEES